MIENSDNYVFINVNLLIYLFVIFSYVENKFGIIIRLLVL